MIYINIIGAKNIIITTVTFKLENCYASNVCTKNKEKKMFDQIYKRED